MAVCPVTIPSGGRGSSGGGMVGGMVTPPTDVHDPRGVLGSRAVGIAANLTAHSRVQAPSQFLGPVHGQKETWATALRRMGGNATRRVLNYRLGGLRQRLRQVARERGLMHLLDLDGVTGSATGVHTHPQLSPCL